MVKARFGDSASNDNASPYLTADCNTDELAAAKEQLAAVARWCPQSSAPMREMAALEFRRERWSAAAELAAQAVERNPRDSFAWKLLATSRFLAGKEDTKLVKDLDSLIKKQKDFLPAITIKAYLDLYKRDDASAASKFEQVLSVNPNHTIALYYLAELAFAAQDYAAANDLYFRLLTADRTRTDVEGKWQKSLLLATDKLLRDAAQSEQENRLADAEQEYRRALRMAPGEPSVNKRLADLLGKEKKWEEALAQYKTQMAIAGRSSDTERHIAEALMNLGRTEEAREILERLRNQGSLDENLESKVNELEDLGRWGNEIDLFRTMKASDSLTREQLAAIVVRYFPQVAEFPQTPQIITDIQNSWARSEIQVSVGMGLLDSFPNHTFQPSAPITRGLLALSMSRLIRLLGLTPSGAPVIPLQDVSRGGGPGRN
jgi:tetratricopeptide (TPR) repeat protein